MTTNQLLAIVPEMAEMKSQPEKLLTEPVEANKWSIREIVGHLFYWDKFNLEVMVPKMADGAVLPPFPDLDAHNAEGIQYINKFSSAEEVIDAFIETRKEFAAKMDSLHPEMSFQIEGESVSFTPASFADIFIEHDQHHLRQMHRFLLGKTR